MINPLGGVRLYIQYLFDPTADAAAGFSLEMALPQHAFMFQQRHEDNSHDQLPSCPPPHLFNGTTIYKYIYIYICPYIYRILSYLTYLLSCWFT